MKKFVVPPGKKTGCNYRKSRFGEVCSIWAEKMEVLSASEIEQAIAARQLGNVHGRDAIKIIFDQDGVGCHDEQTEVLTEVGWQRWPEYDQSSALATVNSSTLALEFQIPTELHIYEYNGPLHCVQNRSHDMAVTPNHRMFVRSWNERERRIVDDYTMRPMENIGWYARLLAAPMTWQGARFTGIQIGNQKYDGDDFVALVAMLVSDGWAGGSESTKHRVSFCCFKPHRVELARKIAARVGFRELSNRPCVFERSDMALANWCRANLYTKPGLRSPNKRVPQLVKCACRSQVGLFLDYFGDKTDTTDRRQFSTTSKQIADDIQELLLRVGKKSGLYSRPMRNAVMKDGREIAASANTEYAITQWAADHVSLEAKKVIVEPYRGMVYCATVPNSTLITRRNGKTLISGNSCAAEACTQGVQSTRVRQNLPYVQLSPWFLYHHSSGGTDNGSSIDENLQIARDIGIASMAIWPREKGWRSKPSAEAYADALNNRLWEFYELASKAEAQTALVKDFLVQFGHDSHSELAVDILDVNTADVANSWAPSWGDKGFHSFPFSGINWGYGCFAFRAAQ